MALTEKQREYQRNYYLVNRKKRLFASVERSKRYKEEKSAYDKERRHFHGDQLRKYDRERSRIYERRINQIVQRAKVRASKIEIPFDIASQDILIPEVCPALGIKLEWHDRQGGHHASPSLDRLIPEKGYVKGNVVVICKRANSIKSDASADEIEKVLMWVRSFQRKALQE